jgi:hypothetical protein
LQRSQLNAACQKTLEKAALYKIARFLFIGIIRFATHNQQNATGRREQILVIAQVQNRRSRFLLLGANFRFILCGLRRQRGGIWNFASGRSRAFVLRRTAGRADLLRARGRRRRKPEHRAVRANTRSEGTRADWHRNIIRIVKNRPDVRSKLTLSFVDFFSTENRSPGLSLKRVDVIDPPAHGTFWRLWDRHPEFSQDEIGKEFRKIDFRVDRIRSCHQIW